MTLFIRMTLHSIAPHFPNANVEISGRKRHDNMDLSSVNVVAMTQPSFCDKHGG